MSSNVPQVSIAYANGNLLANIDVLDGIAGLVIGGTATGQLALYTPRAVYNMNDVKALGINNVVVATARAMATITVTNIGSDGDTLDILYDGIFVGTYTKTSNEANAGLVALAIGAIIQALNFEVTYTTHLDIKAPINTGAEYNGKAFTFVSPDNIVLTTTPFGSGVSAVPNDVAFRQISEYYKEVAGNQELWIMLVAPSMTQEQMLDYTNANGAIKLIKGAKGVIRLLGLCRKPQAGYNPGADFIDVDVPAAVLAAKTFAQSRLAELDPIRILIEGRVANENAATIYHPSSAEVGAAGVVLGGTLPDGSASVGVAIGRAVKYGAHIKLGKRANGPLSITTCYIGSKEIKDVSNLATLHGYGYISFMVRPLKAGFYFGIDRMASTDDFRLLVYGRVIDKIAIIAAAVYDTDLEGEVDTEDNGTIKEAEARHLEDRIKLQVNAKMADQMSGFNALVDTTENINLSSKLPVQLKARPKGYLTDIAVTIGLNAGN